MNKAIYFLAIIATAAQALAGTIIGTVRAHGKVEEGPIAAGGGKYDSRKFKFVEKVNYEEMTDFVVFIEGKPEKAPRPPEKPLEVITQRDAVFRPRVTPIVVGTTVQWPNRDDIYHNVFSMSEPNSFDLGLYKDPEVKEWTFKSAGRVDVFCSIHTKMSCVILVLENPWFAATDKRGRYKIENVPPGKYRLKAWHERMPTQTREIIVPEKGEVEVDFSMGIKGLPQTQE